LDLGRFIKVSDSFWKDAPFEFLRDEYERGLAYSEPAYIRTFSSIRYLEVLTSKAQAILADLKEKQDTLKNKDRMRAFRTGAPTKEAAMFWASLMVSYWTDVLGREYLASKDLYSATQMQYFLFETYKPLAMATDPNGQDPYYSSEWASIWNAIEKCRPGKKS